MSPVNPIQPAATGYENFLSNLGTRFKARGLDLAEDVVRGAFLDVCDEFEVAAKTSPTPLDDIALVVLPELKKKVLVEVDKIDGKVGA